MKHCYFVLLLLGSLAWGQNQNLKELNYNEFLGYVKKYHPLVKSAQLEINMAQANLMMARGGFDPKIEADFDQKQFKGKDYYSVFNSSFKIPTWYGIEVKAGFDNSEGIFVNPENALPNNGLTSLGITVPVGQGLFINQRMADLRKAKIQIQLSQAERKLQAIEVLYNASLAYFNWKRNHSEVQLYSTYLNNAKLRYKGIKTLINNGDKPAIDSVEAGIVVKTRQWNLEESKLKLAKSKLDLSNYLWLDKNIPLELQDDVLPENKLEQTISATLKINQLITDTISIENHPKINSLENKLAILEVDRKLKANSLLPKMDVGYHYLSEPNYWNDTNFNNYKIGVNFKFPLFLRKERGSLQLAKFKIQDTQFSLNLERVQLKNKINAQQTEIKSIEKQLQLLSSLVAGNSQMLQSEERLFSLGESSIFLLNSRENNLVSIQLTQLGLENRFLNSNAELFKIMANPD
ncbi:transporter [Flavobacterium ammoniigenes]|jgi:outer membrane protein TolC|uniref:Transporter n=1 Tax=Flavobacterium ammoniigenes TaxID=1751095 RepID=A0ABN6KXC5_9FLAO|nr:TolC family protein [Flavobacterium ammoniigenes]BDB53870.1 transporter [Flavobacterium ammoniigenes]